MSDRGLTKDRSLACMPCHMHVLASSDSLLVWQLLTCWQSAMQSNLLDSQSCIQALMGLKFESVWHSTCLTGYRMSHSGSVRMKNTLLTLITLILSGWTFAQIEYPCQRTHWWNLVPPTHCNKWHTLLQDECLWHINNWKHLRNKRGHLWEIYTYTNQPQSYWAGYFKP